MGNDLTLSRSELKEITGYVQSKRICAWLTEQGFVYLLGGDGWPRVARDEYRRKMCGGGTGRKRTAPDLSALQRVA